MSQVKDGGLNTQFTTLKNSLLQHRYVSSNAASGRRDGEENSLSYERIPFGLNEKHMKQNSKTMAMVDHNHTKEKLFEPVPIEPGSDANRDETSITYNEQTQVDSKLHDEREAYNYQSMVASRRHSPSPSTPCSAPKTTKIAPSN